MSTFLTDLEPGRWVDLKVLYKRHYRKEAKGGLQACLERVGLTFEGRAHDGLIDSRNTAAIATWAFVAVERFTPSTQNSGPRLKAVPLAFLEIKVPSVVGFTWFGMKSFWPFWFQQK